MPDWAALIRQRLAPVRLSPEREAEVVEELEQHLEDRWRDLVSGGTEPDAATEAILAELRQADLLERHLAPLRQARWTDPSPARPGRSPFHDMLHGLRMAGRTLRASPGFTLIALLVLTLSIGATTAIISVVDAVILNGLPFPGADRLVAVGEWNRKSGVVDAPNEVAPQNFIDWHRRQDVFTGLAAIGYASVSLKPDGGQEPEILKAQAVTADFFPVLGVQPLLGRAFTKEHERDGHARVAVISHALWQRRFGGAPGVIGRVLPGQRGDFEILGVMPPSFAYPVGSIEPTDVWLPNVFRPEDRVRQNSFSYRLQVIGRLRPGVSLGQAQSQMDRITAALAAETPSWFHDRVAKVEFLHGYLVKSVRRWMLMLLSAVGFVLLIACVNLSNLTLARVAAREREFAIRSAMGASRWDLARTLILESLVLSLSGAMLGMFFAWAGVELLRAAIPAGMPRVADIAMNLRVLAAAVFVAIATGLIVSAIPLLHFSSRGSGETLTSATNRTSTANATHQWLRGALVVAQVALAAVLLVGSGLFLVSFQRVAGMDLGLNPRNVMTVRIRPLVGDAAGWQAAQQRNRVLLQNVLERVRAIPGVEVASHVNGGVPLRGDLRTIEFAIPGRVLPPNEDLDFNEISPDYFLALRVPLRKGRFFADGDTSGSESVAILNEAAASKYFPGEDPVGKVVQFEGLRRVVGVVGNIRHDGPEAPWRTQGFVPIGQSQAVGATLVLRFSGEPRNVLPAVKAAIWSQFPGVPLPDTQTLEQYLHALIAQRRLNMLLLSLFGLLGVVIALLGLYGVMSYVVTQRAREIGIRMALGALPRSVLGMVLGRASVYLGAGLAIGLAAAWATGSLVSAFLFQIEARDLRVYLGAAAMLAVTGLAAAFLPARRAARVDPLIALRLE
ncbi:MAG: ABC transporter permease [Bryobacterales bacterium]|nr:ABC transporter permease [Bryobacterales bacterium]